MLRYQLLAHCGLVFALNCCPKASKSVTILFVCTESFGIRSLEIINVLHVLVNLFVYVNLMEFCHGSQSVFVSTGFSVCFDSYRLDSRSRATWDVLPTQLTHGVASDPPGASLGPEIGQNDFEGEDLWKALWPLGSLWNPDRKNKGDKETVSGLRAELVDGGKSICSFGTLRKAWNRSHPKG